MRINIRKQAWRVQFWRKLPRRWGDCDHTNQLIRIVDAAHGETLLDTFIHEILHAALPDLSEDAVTEIATDLAKAILNPAFQSRMEAKS